MFKSNVDGWTNIDICSAPSHDQSKNIVSIEQFANSICSNHSNLYQSSAQQQIHVCINVFYLDI